MTTFIGLGYALPGVVVAIGILIRLGYLTQFPGFLTSWAVKPQL